MPSQYPHRNPIEIKLQDKLDGFVPVYNQDTGLWFTVPTSSFKEGAISSSQQIIIGETAGDTFADRDYVFQRNLTVNQNMFVLGRLTAQEYYTEVVSASIIYEEGSTKFGNSPDDTHEFTGSLLLEGNQFINGNLDIGGNLQFGTAGGATAVFNGNVDILGSTLMENSLIVLSSQDIYGPLYVSDAIQIGNDPTLNHEILGNLQLTGNMNVIGEITASFFNGPSAFAQSSSVAVSAQTSELATSSSFASSIGIISAGLYVTGSDIPIVKR